MILNVDSILFVDLNTLLLLLNSFARWRKVKLFFGVPNFELPKGRNDKETRRLTKRENVVLVGWLYIAKKYYLVIDVSASLLRCDDESDLRNVPSSQSSSTLKAKKVQKYKIFQSLYKFEYE